MESNLLKQLAYERNLRTKEFETHEQEVQKYEKMMKRFDTISMNLIKKLKNSITLLSKYQQECIRNRLAPEIKKITLAIPLLKQRTVDEIMVLLGNIKVTIDKIGKERSECEEETRDNYEMYLDIQAQEDVLKQLNPERYAEFLPQLEELRNQIKQALDTALASISAEMTKARDLIYQYFVELDNVIKQKNYLFNFVEFNNKYNRVKEAYMRVFGEELPVQIEISMDVSADEKLALQLARQFETQGY